MTEPAPEPRAAALPSAARSRLERFADSLFALLMAAGLTLLLVEGVVSLFAPYQLEFGEGNVLASTLLVAQGESAYPPLTPQPPYVISPYGPLLYWVEAPLVRWFGTGFAAGRLLSLLATLASAALLMLLLRRWTGSWRAGLLFGGLYLALPPVGFWATTMRADPLALALSLGGLLVVSTGTRRWPVAALLFSAALLVKPTLIAAPAAVFLYLVFRKERAAAFGFAALVGGIVLGVCGTLQHTTGGAFAVHLFGSHPEPYLPGHYLFIAGLIGTQQLIPTAMLLVFVVLALRRRQITLPLLYIAMAFLATLSAGMAGASSNHFLDWSAAVCVGAGMAYHLAGESETTLAHPLARPLRSAALLAMFACAMLFSSLIWLLWNDAAIDTTDKDYERTPVARIARLVPYQQRVFPIDTDVPRGCIELQEYLASLRVAPLISENTGAALLAGKTLLITDPYSYGELVKTGRLPEAPLLEMLRAHRVGAVVLAHEAGRLRVEKDSRWTPAFLAAVEQDYRLARSFQCTNGSAVYLPR